MGRCSAWQTHLDYCKEGHRSDLWTLLPAPLMVIVYLYWYKQFLEVTQQTELSFPNGEPVEERPSKEINTLLAFLL